jgi:spoIIIJ-associated protein
MPVIEFEGKTTEEAIEKACNQLHIPSDELKFEILSTGSSGIFGLGGKKAAIRVTVQEKISKKPPESKPEPKPEPEPKPQPPTEEPPARPESAPKPEPATDETRPEPEFEPPELAESPPKPSESAGPPADGRAGGRRGGRKRSGRRGSGGPKPVEGDKEKSTPREKEASEDIFKEGKAPLPPTMPGPGESVVQGPEDELMTQSRLILEGILSRMELDAQVTTTRIGERIVLNVTGDNSGLVIGKKGATLDALQFLINKIVNRDLSEKTRVIVDTEEYRRRRQESLVDLARRMADKARRTKRPVTISQLSAHDRRVIHLALQDQGGIKTRSRGDGLLKNVIIIPNSRGRGKGGPPPEAEAGQGGRDEMEVDEELGLADD